MQRARWQILAIGAGLTAVIPDDDMKTLQVPLYLVANKKLSDDVVSSLAQAIMDARWDLMGQDLLAGCLADAAEDNKRVTVVPGLARTKLEVVLPGSTGGGRAPCILRLCAGLSGAGKTH